MVVRDTWSVTQFRNNRTPCEDAPSSKFSFFISVSISATCNGFHSTGSSWSISPMIITCRPPNGSSTHVVCRREMSSFARRLGATMLISSIINNSDLFHVCRHVFTQELITEQELRSPEVCLYLKMLLRRDLDGPIAYYYVDVEQGVDGEAVSLFCCNAWRRYKLAVSGASHALVLYRLHHIFCFPGHVNHHEELLAFADRRDRLVNYLSLSLVEVPEAWLLESFNVGILVLLIIVALVFNIFRLSSSSLLIHPLCRELLLSIVEMCCSVVVSSSVIIFTVSDLLITNVVNTMCVIIT